MLTKKTIKDKFYLCMVKDELIFDHSQEVFSGEYILPKKKNFYFAWIEPPDKGCTNHRADCLIFNIKLLSLMDLALNKC